MQSVCSLYTHASQRDAVYVNVSFSACAQFARRSPPSGHTAALRCGSGGRGDYCIASQNIIIKRCSGECCCGACARQCAMCGAEHGRRSEALANGAQTRT